MEKIKKLQKYFQYKFTELLFGNNLPPQYQCQNFEQHIKTLAENKNKIDSSLACINIFLNNNDIEQLKKAQQHLKSVEDMTEKVTQLKQVIEDLRIWGNQWKNLSKQMYSELPNEKATLYLKNEINKEQFESIIL